MEQCLHRFFVDADEIKSTCDFIPSKYHDLLPVYEVIRVIDGKPMFLNDHLLRLEQSMHILKFPLLLSRHQLHQALKALIQINAVDVGNIRLHIGTFENSVPHYACWWIPHRYPDAMDYQNGVEAILSNTTRIQPNAKVYRETYKNQQQDLLIQENVFETMLYNEHGITEGSKSNVFFIMDNLLITAPDEVVLKGITRSKVIDLCYQLQLPLEFRSLQTTELEAVTAAFITGTSPKVLPIRNIREVCKLNPKHEWIQRIQTAYEESIRNDIARFQW